MQLFCILLWYWLSVILLKLCSRKPNSAGRMFIAKSLIQLEILLVESIQNIILTLFFLDDKTATIKHGSWLSLEFVGSDFAWTCFFFFSLLWFCLSSWEWSLSYVKFARFAHLSFFSEVDYEKSPIVGRAKRERAWKSLHARKGDTRRGERKIFLSFHRVAFRSLYYLWGKMGDYYNLEPRVRFSFGHRGQSCWAKKGL